MPGCAVATCTNTNRKTKGTGIKYFGFPKNEDLAMKWKHACRRRDKINLKNACICSIHFEKESFEIPMRQRLLQYNPKTSRNLKLDAVPVLNLPGTSQKIKNTNRLGRINKRRQRSLVAEILEEAIAIEPQPSSFYEKPKLQSNNETIPNTINVETGGNIINTETNEVKLNEKIKMLEKQNEELLQQVKVANSITEKYEVALGKVFTPGQIKELMHHEKGDKILWTREDISSAISLCSEINQINQPTQTNSIQSQSVRQTDADEISLYGELLVTKLRKFDRTTRLIICNKIDNLIFETELKLMTDGKNSCQDPLFHDVPTTSRIGKHSLKRSSSHSSFSQSEMSENPQFE